MKLFKKSTFWSRFAVLPIAPALLAVLFAGCSDDYLAIVAVSPGIVGVVPGGEVQFSSAVVGIKDQDVKWAVNEVIGGDETFGTISEDGLYTAPAEIPDEATVKITAMCSGDPSVSGNAKAIIVGTLSFEMEDFLTSYDEEGGRAISVVNCGGASGGRAVEGFDIIGDYLMFQIPIEAAGRYEVTLRQAALSGAESTIKATIEEASSGGSDQVTTFDILGQGIG